jgi:hypothetical protein
LFFNSLNRLGGFGGFDIWASYRENSHDDFGWQPPVNLGPGVNSRFNDVGPGYFENDDSGVPLLFFSSNRPDPRGRGGRLDIYVSAQQAGGSFGPAKLVEELSTPANEVRPSLRSDGLELFFTRDNGDNPLLQNDNDIWVSTRRSVSAPWGTPLNLGPTVNSAVDDIRAYISADRRTLFFESGPLEPNGDMDIYMTTRSKKRGCDCAADFDSSQGCHESQSEER